MLHLNLFYTIFVCIHLKTANNSHQFKERAQPDLYCEKVKLVLIAYVAWHSVNWLELNTLL